MHGSELCLKRLVKRRKGNRERISAIKDYNGRLTTD